MSSFSPLAVHTEKVKSGFSTLQLACLSCLKAKAYLEGEQEKDLISNLLVITEYILVKLAQCACNHWRKMTFNKQSFSQAFFAPLMDVGNAIKIGEFLLVICRTSHLRINQGAGIGPALSIELKDAFGSYGLHLINSTSVLYSQVHCGLFQIRKINLCR